MGKRKPPPKRKPRPQPRGGTPVYLPAAVVLGLVAVAVIIFIVTRPGPPPPPPKHTDYIATLSSIPASDLDQVGIGSASSARFKAVTEPHLTSDGKPELLYIGAEYCPYCAGERWALIVALARFGSFSGVTTLTSSEGNLPTFTFHGSSYSSAYLAFRPVEAGDLNGKPLDHPTAAESALEQRYASGIPFIDFGNRFLFDGATYDVGQLSGLDWQQVVDALKQPSSGQAQGILGSANLIAAGICRLTGGLPASVCSTSVVQGLDRQLPNG